LREADVHRRGIQWAGVWVRECKRQTDIAHDYFLFHLPLELCTVATLQALEVSILRLVAHHGGGVTSHKAVDLKLYPNGVDGRYLLKGGGRQVWEKYRLPKKWQRMQVSTASGPALRRTSVPQLASVR
jgi:hypothetical protein